MAETKKRTYQVETILPDAIKPARKPVSRATLMENNSTARRQIAVEGQPRQDLIIRLIDYLKSI